jgi:hypothetical protein
MNIKEQTRKYILDVFYDYLNAGTQRTFDLEDKRLFRRYFEQYFLENSIYEDELGDYISYLCAHGLLEPVYRYPDEKSGLTAVRLTAKGIEQIEGYGQKIEKMRYENSGIKPFDISTLEINNNIENNPPNAFISYQTRDKLIAGKIKQILGEYGIDAFLAHEDLTVSDEWQDEILKNIREKSLFICILSKNFLKSSYCLQESGIAIISNMTVVPLSIDDTTSPGFMSKYQSKKIDQDNISIHDIMPGLLKNNRIFGINIIIDIIVSSSSYRGAEKNFKLILPFLSDLNSDQVNKLVNAIINNSQIKGAKQCALDYIPLVWPIFF